MMIHLKRKDILLIGAAAGLVLGAVVPAICLNQKEETVYKETQVQFGNLMVGVTEEGSVDIGTVEQSFDLDMTALQRANTGSTSSTESAGSSSGGGWGGAMAGGMGGASGGGNLNMFGQLFNMAGEDSFSTNGSDASLTVSKVYVTVGQQVSEGDLLYGLEEESVLELEEQLQTNVEKAQADLDAVYADQTLSKQEAQYTYDSSVAYGSYADTEYATTLQGLENAVTEAATTLSRAQESLAEYEAQLAEVTASYEDAARVLANCEWSRDNTDKFDAPYDYVMYFQMAQEAESTATSLEQQKEQLERSVEQASQNVETAQKQYHQAVRSEEQGKLSATQTLSLRRLANSTAQETYDISLAYLEGTADEQETVYAEAQEAWEAFSSHIRDNNVCAACDGVITGVELAEGDSIYTGTVLVTLYNMEEVTMTVTLEEDDRKDVSPGSLARVHFTAYPDALFEAEVTEIGDAESDSDGNVTYEVTVTLEGDVSGLFQGMTGEITFVTEEQEEVLYVSRRAIITEGDQTYVKVRNENGKVQKKKVVTGFTDGTNMEITEGLSEGDIVLIESKAGSR